MSLEKYSDIYDTVRRSSDKFSFTKKLADFTTNRDFRTGYDSIYHGKSTTETFMWEALSAIGEDTGDIIYNNVVKYIDNVSNIDLCKVKSLKSMIKSFGLTYGIFDSTDFLPIEIERIMDTLSINKTYLLKNDIISQKLIDELTLSTYNQVTINDISTNFEQSALSELCSTGYIQNQKYYDFLSTTYYNTLTNLVYLPYNYSGGEKDYIYRHLSNDLLDKTTDVEHHVENSKYIKLKNSIPYTFNEEKIVDEIENGRDFIDNYSGARRQLIDLEIEYRSKPMEKYISDKKTRYYYYRENKVKEIFDFIEQKYYIINNGDGIERTPYSIDNNYMVLSNMNKEYLLSNDGNTINISMISDIANDLAATTLYIAKLRDDLKVNTIKNYMKGTWNLLSYVINEYIVSMVQNNSTVRKCLQNGDKERQSVMNMLSTHSTDDINVIEYNDVTEYFNINTVTSDKAYNSRYTNSEYWSGTDNSYYGYAFTQDQIENFYLSTMNMKQTVGSLEKFLSSIYSTGADRTYITDTGELSTWSEDKKNANKKLFYSYTGLSIGTDPTYNHKNITHPSYQVHPYLYNFVQKTNFNYPIENSFSNEINSQIEEQAVKQKIKQRIGEFGEVKNIWKNNTIDYSGYVTDYEYSSNKLNMNEDATVYVKNYDGAFYPPALKQLLDDTEGSIHSLVNQTYTSDSTPFDQKTFFEKYYSHLNLTTEEYEHIGLQLSSNMQIIRQITKTVQDEKDVYDIYKYGKDVYQNMYVLYKKYNVKNPTYRQKENTPGQLWVRLKDHPIAIPAFFGENPQVSDEEMNGKIPNIALDGNPKTDPTQMSYFYDIDFDRSKRCLFLMYYQVNDSDHYGKYVINFEKPVMKDIRHCDIAVCNIEYLYDNILKYNILKLTKDRTVDIDAIYNPFVMFSQQTITEYVGFQKNGNDNSFFFVAKNTLDNYETDILDNRNIKMYCVKYSYHKKGRYEQNTYTLDFSDRNIGDANYRIRPSTEVKFSHYGQTITFAFITDSDNEKLHTYLGQYTDTSEINYISSSTDDLESEYGPVFDQNKTDMNSSDRLDGYITVIDAITVGNNLKIKSICHYNLNGDASYIPLYPSMSCFVDLSQDPYFRTKEINNIELMGRSKDIDNYIDTVNVSADYEYELNRLSSFVYGRVYEDFIERNKLEERSLKVFSNSLLKHKSGSDIPIIWNINLNDYEEKELSDLNIIVYNSSTYGKNPYFIDNISSLTNGEEKDLYYMQKDDISEVSSTVYPDLFLNGTYNFFDKRRGISETNHIDNIRRITLQYNKSFRNIKLCFYIDEADRNSFIHRDTVKLIAFNEKYYRLLNLYHMLDSNGLIKCDEGCSIENDAYVEKDGVRTYLSSFDISSFNEPSDVWFLSGYSNNLTFKYDEEYKSDDTFYHYHHGHNDCYPDRLVQYFKKNTNVVNIENIFDENTLYVFNTQKLNVIDSIGQIDITRLIDEQESYRAFEDYQMLEYDTEDPMIYKYLHCANDKVYTSLSTTDFMDNEGNYIVGVVLNSVNESDDMDRVQENLLKNGFYTVMSETSVDNLISTYSSYVIRSGEFDQEKLKKLFNIYVNYKKEEDQTITIYFNYYNYLNTPFVQLLDNRKQAHVIDGTYLKLKTGEDGILNVYVQFKKYDSRNQIAGTNTMKILQYHIWNVSDDKPKFLITNQDVGQDQTEYNQIVVIPENQLIDITIDKYNDDDNITFEHNVQIMSTVNYRNLEFFIKYNKEQIIYNGNDEHVEKCEEGILKITSSEMIEEIPLTFTTRKTVYQMKQIYDVLSYEIMAYSAHAEIIYDDTSTEEINAKTMTGLVNIYHTNILRQELITASSLISSETINDISSFII